MKKNIYLDHNATTALHPQVKEAMIEAMGVFGNPSSIHAQGRKARALVEKAREEVALSINADRDEIVFTASGSEANNTLLHTFFHHNKKILISSIEHPCIYETVKKHHNPSVCISVDQYGKIDMPKLTKALEEEKIGLVSIMLANNEIGTIQDIKEIAMLAHSYGALVHTDAVQAFGKIPVDVRELDVDYLTISAHKVYGPKGTGALYVKRGSLFSPLIYGGHQEKNKRAGTENVLGIIGFGKAASLAMQELKVNAGKYMYLKKRLLSGIEKNIPDITVNGHLEDCVPNTLNITFSGVEGESMALYLDEEGVCVSTGSACSSATLDPSYVLLAIGASHEHAHASIRFSLGRENTQEEIDYVIETLPKIMQKLRHMSTVYQGA